MPSWLRQACQRLRPEIRRRYFLDASVQKYSSCSDSGGGIVFTPIATALTVVGLRRTRPETLVDFGALLVGAAAVAFYTLVFVWTVGLVLYEVLLSA